MALIENSTAQRPSTKEWIIVGLVTVFMLLATAVPYWLATTTTQPDQFFTGTLMNPEDSQTYFAKMQQGFDGK